MAKKRVKSHPLVNLAITNILLVFQRRHEKESSADTRTHDDTHQADLQCRIPVGSGRSTEILKRIIWRGVRELVEPDDEYVYAKARFTGERFSERRAASVEVEIFRTIMPRKEIAVFLRNL